MWRSLKIPNSEWSTNSPTSCPSSEWSSEIFIDILIQIGLLLLLKSLYKPMSFEKLEVYRIAFQLESKLFEILSKKQAYRFENTCQQILRSSSSVSANIAEGCGKKYFTKEFIRFLNIALGSSDETQHHLKALFLRKFVLKEDYDYFARRYKNLSVKILNLISYLRSHP